MERAYVQRSLRIEDVEAAYAGLFLQVVLGYEAAIEDFVLGLLVRPGGVASSSSHVRSHVQVRSYAHARKLVSGPGRSYPSWTKKADIENIADVFLADSLPFKTLDPHEPLSWDYVNRCIIIRNAIAHASDHAKMKFEQKVIGDTPLPKRERRVSAYLRGRATLGPQTRWENLSLGLWSFINAVVV
jgi:hypothetical protein